MLASSSLTAGLRSLSKAAFKRLHYGESPALRQQKGVPNDSTQTSKRTRANRKTRRCDSAATTFASVNDLASAMRRASLAHGEHEARTGGQRDENWPDWYARYMVAEQAGAELPQ